MAAAHLWLHTTHKRSCEVSVAMSRSLHTHVHPLLTYDACLTAMQTYNTCVSEVITSIALRCKTHASFCKMSMMIYTLQINDCEVTHMPEANIHWCYEDSQSVPDHEEVLQSRQPAVQGLLKKVSRMQRGADLETTVHGMLPCSRLCSRLCSISH